MDRKTIRKYVAPAVAAGIAPGGPAKSESEWQDLVREWFPELADTRLRQVTWPAIAEHHDYIAGAAQGRGADVDDPPAAAGRARPGGERRELPPLCRRERPGGGPPVAGHGLEPAAGRGRGAGADRLRDAGPLARPGDREAADRLGVRDGAGLLAAHVRPPGAEDGPAGLDRVPRARRSRSSAASRPGWCPDNLKTGVDKPDLYDPKINRSYAELAAHYGCLVDPARALKPRDKARVERPMPYVRDCFWRGREFTSLEQMQAEAARWSAEVAGQRACRPLDGAAPAAVFEAVEKEALRPLPAGPFVLATWATAKIGPDIHAQVDKVLYSVPWRHIGKTADVRLTATMVQFFIGGQLVKSHPRKARGKQTDFGDYPPEKIAFHMRTPQWCRRQAAGVGPACEYLVGELLAENALYRLRAAQGVIGLADKHDPGPARGGLREGGRRRRPVLPDGAGHPRRRRPSGTSCPPRPGTAGRPRSCAARPRSRTSSPCPARSPATPSPR